MTFDEIVKRCKASVTLTVNDHRTEYINVQQYLERDEDVTPEDLRRMIEAGTIYELQFYPDTPVGFYRVYGISFDEVVQKAGDILKEEHG